MYIGEYFYDFFTVIVLSLFQKCLTISITDVNISSSFNQSLHKQFIGSSDCIPKSCPSTTVFYICITATLECISTLPIESLSNILSKHVQLLMNQNLIQRWTLIKIFFGILADFSGMFCLDTIPFQTFEKQEIIL